MCWIRGAAGAAVMNDLYERGGIICNFFVNMDDEKYVGVWGESAGYDVRCRTCAVY